MASSVSVLCVGVNPALDVVLQLDPLRTDRTNRVRDEHTAAAGKAANVAAELLRQGVDTSVIGLAGRDNGHDYRALLERRLAGEQPAELIFTPGKVRENLTLLTDGETIKINRAGMRCEPAQLAALKQLIAQRVQPGMTVVFSGSMPDGMTSDDYCTLMRTASDAGARLAVDTDALSREQLLSVRPWLYKPNEHELAALCELPGDDERALIGAAAGIAACGVEIVLLTLGARGLAVVSGEGVVRLSAVETEEVCTVGAGDCALGGFIAAQLRGDTLRECGKAAALSGARAVAACAEMLPI